MRIFEWSSSIKGDSKNRYAYVQIGKNRNFRSPSFWKLTEAMSSSAYSPFLRIQSKELSGQGRWLKQELTGVEQEIIWFWQLALQKIALSQALFL